MLHFLLEIIKQQFHLTRFTPPVLFQETSAQWEILSEKFLNQNIFVKLDLYLESHPNYFFG